MLIIFNRRSSLVSGNGVSFTLPIKDDSNCSYRVRPSGPATLMSISKISNDSCLLFYILSPMTLIIMAVNLVSLKSRNTFSLLIVFNYFLIVSSPPFLMFLSSSARQFMGLCNSCKDFWNYDYIFLSKYFKHFSNYKQVLLTFNI